MPSTRLLYLERPEAAYDKEFTARIVRRGKDFLVLDQTLFYPTGGGQEHDTGTLTFDGGECRVVNVAKKGEVLHYVDRMPPDGVAEVRGRIDWERRYAHMRMHTAQHLVSGVAYDLFQGVRTVGNQIHADRSRIDFNPIKFDPAMLGDLEARVNEAISTKAPLVVYEEDRDTLWERLDPARSNLDLLPKAIPRLRMVEIRGWDTCPCAGTHVQSIGELGDMEVLGRESKGADTERLSFTLDGLKKA